VITADELQWRLDLGRAAFDIVFKRGQRIYIRTRSASLSIKIKHTDDDEILIRRGDLVELHDKDIINIDGNDMVSFYRSTSIDQEA
jgi:hypothetical protein